MKDSVNVDIAMQRTRSTSTCVSEAPTLHSIPSTSSHPKKSDVFWGMETVLGQDHRTHSRFAESVLRESDNTPLPQSTRTQQTAHSTVPEKTPPESDAHRLPYQKTQHPSATPHPRSGTAHYNSRDSYILGATMTSNRSGRRTSVTHAPATTDHQVRHSTQRASFRHALPSPTGSRPRAITSARRSRTLSGGATFDDPYLTHQRARQMFQSFGSAIGPQQPRNSEYQEPLTETVTSPLPLTQPEHYERGLNISHMPYTEKRSEEMSYSSTPCTVIDWTAPATRRREYEKIDRSSRGVRGLWYKVLPRWCRSSGRTRFYEGDKDDAMSVRRYRMDIFDEDEDDAEKGEGVDVNERELKPPLFRSKTTWSCFNSVGGRTNKIS